MNHSETNTPVVRVNVVEPGGYQRKGWINCNIDEHFKFSAESLASYYLLKWETAVFDAMLLAASVELCDHVKARPKYGWARTIQLRLPVHEPDTWNAPKVNKSLVRALEFLTGDYWQIEFVTRKKSERAPGQHQLELKMDCELAVIPFSEGLDSRAVAGLVGQKMGAGLLRVRVGKKALDRPFDADGRPLPFRNLPYKVKPSGLSFPESSARTRGFKFALLSGIAAHLSGATKVIVPESGQGALGPTLVTVGQSYDDFRNHPAFTAKMAEFLNALLGAKVVYEFPRLWFTKGETLRDYARLPESSDWVETRSCWQDNRHASVNGHRRQCGICAACMLRRLSVHAAGLSEPKDKYIWDDLNAPSFEEGAAKGLKKIEKVQRQYAVAGTLHLDHLASLRSSPTFAHGLKTSARLLSRSLNLPIATVETNLDRLLSQHKNEWNAYMDSLGSDSFIKKWTETTQ
jgi:hypothetical protein